ncbi:MAG: TraK family protein [Methylococcaceae bacterium]|nr:TraK family protein [Methylococcaceae bacterium]
MAKNLSERIAAMAIKKKPSRRAKNRATFLALRVDVKQALDDGWPVKSIWETLHEEGKVDFSYQSFRVYVNRLILTPAELILVTANFATYAASREQTNHVPTSANEKKAKELTENGFKFNKTPKKEDLL